MERRLILVVLLFAVFEIHCQAPTAAAGGLEVGATYSFRYNTTVLLSELRPRAGGRGVKDVGYQILADAQCAVIWQHPSDHQQQLLRITVTSPQLLVRSRKAPQPDGFSPHSSRLDNTGPVDVLLLTSTGGRPKLYRHPDRSEAETGLARGLVGLLTIRPEGQYRETDASGECDVTYRSEGPQTLVKTKERCDDAAPVHTASHPVLDVSVTSERVTWYTLSGGRLDSAVSEEHHSVTPAVRAGYGTLVTSLQTLQLTGREFSAPSVSAASPEEALLLLSEATLGWRPQETGLTAPATGTQRQCGADAPCIKLSELVSELRSSLTEQSVASLAAAGASIALVPALRAATQEEVLAVLADKRNKQIRLSLLDAAGAAQTVAVHSAVRKALGWPPAPSDDIEPHERYLVSLATASHPPRQLVKELIAESRRRQSSPELHQTVVLTAASLAATHCSQAGDAGQVCDGLSAELVSQLHACRSSDPEDDQSACCLLPLRALTNLRSAAAVPALIQQAMAADSGSDCRAEALRALSALPADVTTALRPELERLYGQPDRYDVTSRLLAADLLLASPRASDAGQLLCRLEQRNASEENAYVLQRLKAAAARNHALQRSLRHLLADGRVGNYDVLAQGALSSVLERKLWSSGGVSAGFASQLEVGKSRALRRSGFSAQLEAAGHRLDLLTFSVQAAGLSGMTGSPDPEDAADAQARLQLGLLGRQLRPRQLFASQSELMTLLWSGAGSETTSALKVGSETTSALKGTVLLQDHLQEVPLQNGLSARLVVMAAVTFDLAGRIEVSLWNRAAQAELDDRAAVLLRGLATVHTPFVRARMEVSQALEARLDANTDMQFSDGLKTCARISHAPLVLREIVRKQERVPGSRHRLRRVRRQSRTWGGTTFSLNQQNADNCRAMFG